MKRHAFLPFLMVAAIFPGDSIAAPNIERATITEVVNNVSIIDRSTKTTSAAKLKNVLNAPNILRTGAESRAELVADDNTVTRVGQNTVFSFQPGSREVNLEKGSLLFQSPSGKGGGQINTPSASAAVLGTTLIVTTTKNGGFKVLLLEGHGRVRNKDGTSRNLRSGQMVFALPNGGLSKVFTFQLSQQVAASKLVGGFKKTLPSKDKISKAINRQEREIASGQKITTELLASDSPDYAYQVDVAQDALEEQQEEQADDISAFQKAIATDASVSDALDPAFLFTFDGENKPELSSPPRAFLDKEQEQDTSDAALYIAQNLSFETSSLDLSEYDGRSVFQFVSVKDMSFEGSMDFTGLSTTELQVIAGGSLEIPDDSTFTANTSLFGIASLGSELKLDDNGEPESGDNRTPVSLNGFTMINHTGSLSIAVPEGNFNALTMEAEKDIFNFALTDLNYDSDVVFSPAAASGGSSGGGTSGGPTGTPTVPPKSAPGLGDVPKGVNKLQAKNDILIHAKGDVNARALVTESQRISIQAGKDIRLVAVDLRDLGSLGGTLHSPKPTVYMRAEDSITARAVRFQATDVMLQARTLNLHNVAFEANSRVILESVYGQANFGASRFGYVNFSGTNFYGSDSFRNQSEFDSINSDILPKGKGMIVQPLRNSPKP